MNINNRKSVHEDMKKFSPMCNRDEYIEITEWTNGEGWDIQIGDNKNISLHGDELEAINYLIKVLQYEEV